MGDSPSGIDFNVVCTSWASEVVGPWWHVSLSRSVVDDGLLFWILDDFGRRFRIGIEGNGFLLYSDICTGSLGVYEGCVTFSDLGGVETSSQSSESVGDGDGPENSTAGS